MAVDADTAGQLTAEKPEDAHTDRDETSGRDAEVPEHQQVRSMRWPIALATAMVIVVAGLFGWLSYRAYDVREAQQQRDQFLAVGRQAALNLATISSNKAEADVQRILDSSIGAFHDDFARRAPAFIDAVKKAQANATGEVTAAGLESEAPDKAQVLVAVSVKTSIAGSPDQRPRAWRMRVMVQKVPDGTKVTDVVFVP